MDITSGYDDIYKTILIDTPVGPYFEEFLKTVGSSEESKIFVFELLWLYVW